MNDLADKLCGLLAEHALDGDGPALHAMRDALEKTGVADALKDAERYRWLRDRAENPWPVNSPEMLRLYIIERDPTLDQAIDAAMNRRRYEVLTDERLKQLMQQVGMPDSTSLCQALRQCDMEATLAERERCASICDDLPVKDSKGAWFNNDMRLAASECAAAIRSS